MADSCYSGKLIRGFNLTVKSKSYIERIVRKKARSVLTSGGIEPVYDRAQLLAYVFQLNAYQENKLYDKPELPDEFPVPDEYRHE